MSPYHTNFLIWTVAISLICLWRNTNSASSNYILFVINNNLLSYLREKGGTRKRFNRKRFLTISAITSYNLLKLDSLRRFFPVYFLLPHEDPWEVTKNCFSHEMDLLIQPKFSRVKSVIDDYMLSEMPRTITTTAAKTSFGMDRKQYGKAKWLWYQRIWEF